MNDVKALKGSQRKYLRGLSHKLNPAAVVGQKGITQGLIDEITKALDAAELIKIKFAAFKKKDQKKTLLEWIAASTKAHLAGMTGHVAILYRQNSDTEKQQITLPE